MNTYMATSLLLSLCGSILLGGCVAPVAVGLYEAAVVGGGVAVGAAAYNAADDSDPAKGQGNAASAPMYVDFRADLRKTKNAILEAFAESNDTVENVTDSLVKSKKAPYGEQPGAFKSFMGKGSVSVAKTLTLNQEAKGVTRVTMKVDMYRKTPMTDEAQQNWPDQESIIRAAFFDKLGKKLPAMVAKKSSR